MDGGAIKGREGQPTLRQMNPWLHPSLKGDRGPDASERRVDPELHQETPNLHRTFPKALNLVADEGRCGRSIEVGRLEPEHVAHEHDRRNDLVPVYGREIRQTQNSSTSPEARKCRSSTMRL
jgi:hypothetical protein